MMNKKIIFVFICFLSLSKIFAQDKIFYVSPGISISWDLNGNFLFSPKLSFGLYKEGNFYNITIGHVSSEDNLLYPYYYVESQFGVLSEPMEFRKLQLFTGGGIGIAIHPNDGENKVSFRLSIFTGYLLFVKASFLYKDRLNTDLGIETVLPIPLSKIDFGSPDGLK